MAMFPVISSGSKIVSSLTGYLQPQSVFFIPAFFLLNFHYVP